MNMVKVGPAGGKKAAAWDDKGKGEIAKIYVSHWQHGINSLQFLFVENDNFVLSERHGAAHNKNFTTVVLDHPSEFLTSIRGFHNVEKELRKIVCLRSITFGTNKGTYGPYGMTTSVDPSLNEHFNFEIGDDRSFGGFHGTNYSNFIESIGVYVKTVTSSMIRTKDSRVKVKKEAEHLLPP
ncbi:inactive protein RESTRICTED TEV MOVEMENT 1-like [Lycium ferocissimum]|uniref:inactive protein RESTRICTED TEV MOVEMENT 1-like n=1 Tax=Lycium ferocissimum TaxID=112874 RepID=UPI0028153CCC|nr:inactive protein RESTRICTED TEV MOVEMENT 1-like [Lycium ferocissimum]